MALYPHVFNAGASLAGAPFGSANDFIEAIKVMIDGINKTPEQWSKIVRDEHINEQINYLKLVIVHGTKDMIVNINNSYQLVKQWTSLQLTDTLVDKNLKNYEGNSNVSKLIYYSQNNENE